MTDSAPSRRAAVATSIAVLPAAEDQDVGGRPRSRRRASSCVWKMKSSASQTPGRSSPSIPSGAVRPRPTPRNTASYSARSPGTSAAVDPVVRGGGRCRSRGSCAISDEGELGRDLVGGDPQGVEPAGDATGPRRRRPRARACRSSWAQLRPAGPEPMTATRRPVGGPGSKKRTPRSTAASQAWRWRRPIGIGAFSRAWSTQAPSQRTSVGQARAQLPPKMLAVEDRPGGADLVAVEDLADELGDVDAGRAGPGARGVEAEEAARRLGQRLVEGQRGRDRRRSSRPVARGSSRSPALRHRRPSSSHPRSTRPSRGGASGPSPARRRTGSRRRSCRPRL